MTALKNFVVPFSEVSKNDLGLAGGKGANLGEMVRLQLPVPDGFIVTSYAYHTFLKENNLEIIIKHLLEHVNYSQQTSIEQASKHIKKYILQGKLSDTLVTQVFSAYKHLGGIFHDPFVAVRSSATTEDLPEASFAGQQESFLNIKGEANVLLYIKYVWASLFDSRTLFYRQQKHFDHFKIDIAVCVQKMIQSEQSGVMFTIDPVTNDREKIIIEAIYGLGELIVQGEITPDHYEVDKKTLTIIAKNTTIQKNLLQKKQQQNRKLPIPVTKGKKQKITDEQIVKLAKLGKKLENHYAVPQDIEWAIEKNNIYIVQTRPITKTNIKNNTTPISTISKHTYMHTATKVYVNLSESKFASHLARQHVDGIGLLHAQSLIEHIGEHPKKIIQEGKKNIYIEKLANEIKTVCNAFTPRPVVYQVSDFKTNDYRNLKGGKLFEPTETNPLLGYRGAYRYIHDPEVLQLELEAIKMVRNKDGLKNIWLMIPFVRTVQELIEVKKIIAASGLYRSPSFKLWLMVEVPSTVILLEKFIQAGIDGISIDSTDLTALLLGIDRDNAEVGLAFNEQNEAVMWAFERIITISHTYNIPVSFSGQAVSHYSSLLEKLVQWGITSVSVSPDTIDTTREIVASVEKRLLSKK